MEPIIDGIVINLQQETDVYLVITSNCLIDRPFTDNRGLEYPIPEICLRSAQICHSIREVTTKLTDIYEQMGHSFSSWDSWVNSQHFTCPADGDVLFHILDDLVENLGRGEVVHYRPNLYYEVLITRQPLRLFSDSSDEDD